MIGLQLPGAALPRVVMASNNPKKAEELRRVLAALALPVEVACLADFAAYDEPAETASDFEGNALIKARAAAANTGLTAVADDSGLEVDVLNRMPGVRSARWAGSPGDDQRNLDLVLAQTADVPEGQRGARFVCAIALVTPEGREKTWRATMEGRLAREPRGGNGFGYDPIFLPEGYEITSAELSPEEKDAISHRGKALRLMAAELPGFVGVVEQ